MRNSFTFVHEFDDSEDGGQDKTISITVDNLWTWDDVLQEFVLFLKGCGYMVECKDTSVSNPDGSMQLELFAEESEDDA